jgi:hypothetical protein
MCNFLKYIIYTDRTVLSSVFVSIATCSNNLLSPTSATLPIKGTRIFIEELLMKPKNLRWFSLHKIHQSFVKKQNPIELCAVVVYLMTCKGGN